MSGLLLVPGIVGRTLSIEELVGMLPTYRDGTRPRGRSVARRLAPILELVSRGPNGSRGRGATYRIRPPPSAEVVGRIDVDDVAICSDEEWLLEQVERMTAAK